MGVEGRACGVGGMVGGGARPLSAGTSRQRLPPPADTRVRSR